MPSDPESSGEDLHNLSLISFGSFMASFPVMYLVCSHFFKSFGITRTILIQVSHIHYDSRHIYSATLSFPSSD